MKLWQKTFLVSLAFVMISIAVTALTVLSSYFSSSIKREKSQSISTHEYYAASISNNIAYERIKQGQIILKENEVEKVIEKMVSLQSSSNIGIAVYNEKGEISTVHAGVVSDMPDFISDVKKSDKYSTIIKDYNNSTQLIVGSEIKLEGTEYYLFTVNNITEIYAAYYEQLEFIKFISVVFAVITSLLLLIIVFRLLSPLTKVNGSIKKISGGDYSIRVNESGGAEFRELAENINVMAESIENNVDKIQRIADNRKQFIDNMSHEMKTPLTSIMCLADVLRIKRSVNEKERREYAGIIVEEAKRLKGLSEKLLELSIADNAQLEFEEANIKDILGEIYLAYSPVLQKRNMIMVISEIDAFIRIDKELFKSMLFNLIDNAQKASEDGQAIRIKCAIVEDDLVISISDEGIGMSKLEIKKITEPFYMVDKSRSRKSGGAGLGLSLCISIAKCHNANLSIKSIIGKGTTVFLRIPTVMGDRSL